MDKFRGKYRISSTRMQKWDYGWNAPYFFTLCTADRNHYFGEIMQGEMRLSETGELANKFWHEIPNHFPFVQLDAIQIMPNHIHGILIIDKMADRRVVGSADGSMVGSGDGLVDGSADPTAGIHDNNDEYNEPPQDPDPSDDFDNPIDSGNPVYPEPVKMILTPGQKRYQNQGKDTLSSILGSYKSVVTKYAHKINPGFGWQSRFYDHIIRDNASHQRIRHYILNNPKNWKDDNFFL